MARDLQYLLDVDALRALVTRAAIALDTRQFDEWLNLCTPDVVLIFPLDPLNPIVIKGRAAFREQLNVLNAYEATTHFTGNMVATIEDDSAETETYCIAHHIQLAEATRTNLQMAMRYRDSFVRTDCGWRMRRREMIIMSSAVVPADSPTDAGRDHS